MSDSSGFNTLAETIGRLVLGWGALERNFGRWYAKAVGSPSDAEQALTPAALTKMSTVLADDRHQILLDQLRTLLDLHEMIVKGTWLPGVDESGGSAQKRVVVYQGMGNEVTLADLADGYDVFRRANRAITTLL